MYSGANVLEEVVPEDLVRSSAVAVQRAERAAERVADKVAEQVSERVISADEATFPAALFIPTRRGWYVPIKTAAEWLIALALLVLTAPLMLVLMILVKATSPGPMFYA